MNPLLIGQRTRHASKPVPRHLILRITEAAKRGIYRVIRHGSFQREKGWEEILAAGQYPAPRDGRRSARHTKLVHNIVLSMPSPTPPEKFLAAARKFAREKFALRHRYAMVLHTDQHHPHVHMVVKAESEDGRRLHIDKIMLRDWREDFARLMREQGIAVNATSRVVRCRNKGKGPDPIHRAQRHGASSVVRQRVAEVVANLASTGSFSDPSRARLLETRRTVLHAWFNVADSLDIQGEATLAGDVRQFARRLPHVLTDSEQIASALLGRSPRVSKKDLTRDDARCRATHLIR